MTDQIQFPKCCILYNTWMHKAQNLSDPKCYAPLSGSTTTILSQAACFHLNSAPCSYHKMLMLKWQLCTWYMRSYVIFKRRVKGSHIHRKLSSSIWNVCHCLAFEWYNSCPRSCKHFQYKLSELPDEKFHAISVVNVSLRRKYSANYFEAELQNSVWLEVGVHPNYPCRPDL
jgi:hypothetical protein